MMIPVRESKTLSSALKNRKTTVSAGSSRIITILATERTLSVLPSQGMTIVAHPLPMPRKYISGRLTLPTNPAIYITATIQ